MRGILGLILRMAAFTALWSAMWIPVGLFLCAGMGAADEPDVAVVLLQLMVTYGRFTLLFATLLMVLGEWVRLDRYLSDVSGRLMARAVASPPRPERSLVHGLPLFGAWVVWVLLLQVQSLWSHMTLYVGGLLVALPWAITTILVGALFMGRLTLWRYDRARKQLVEHAQGKRPTMLPLTVATSATMALVASFVTLPHMTWLKGLGWGMVFIALALFGDVGTGEHGKGELLVTLGPDDSIHELAPLLRSYNARAELAVPQAAGGSVARTYVVETDGILTLLLWVALLEDDENVALADFNWKLAMNLDPVTPGCAWGGAGAVNDPHAQLASGLESALLALPRARGPALLAVVDSGIADHEDLRGVVVDGGYDAREHGTSVAGAAAAITNNGRGIASLNVDGQYIRVLDVDTLAGRYAAADDVAEGIVTAANAGAKVIVVAAAGTAFGTPQLVQGAIDYARSRDAIVVVAAGNQGGHARGAWPANASGVVVDSATDGVSRAGFSPATTGMENAVWAPGVGVCVPTADGGYARRSGTSFAAPVVAGWIATYRAICPSRSAEAVVRDLMASTREAGPGVRVVRPEVFVGRAARCAF